MAFRDLHEIEAMFSELDGRGGIEPAFFDAWLRKLGRDKEYRKWNRARIRASWNAWARRNGARLAGYQRARRARERLIVVGERLCSMCGCTWPLTKAQRIKGKRFCSRRCSGKFNRQRALARGSR